MTKKPWSLLSPPQGRRTFRALLLTWLALTIALWLVDRRITADSPHGIVAYELARTEVAASEILDSWDSRARLYAAFSLGLDYLYLVVYPALLSLACVLVAGRLDRSPRARILGHILARLMIAPLVLDAVENFALLRMLVDDADDGWARLAFWCAVPKFGVLLLGLAYIAVGYLASLRRQGVRAPSRPLG